MKVVLFCGGQGLRLRELSRSVPKPMATIGPRPVLWHVMRYYAHFGHRDFVLCLGYRGEVIKDYFLHYDETVSNDFVLAEGGRSIELLNVDIQDWRITFVNTGPDANIGQRLLAVKPHVVDEPIFLANYADGLTDAPLDPLIADFERRDKVAAFISIRPPQTFHVLSIAEDGDVEAITHVRESDIWMNGGYFLFRNSIFDYIKPGEDLVDEPFRRLIEERQLIAYQHTGFWRAMDTLKEMQELEALHETGRPPGRSAAGGARTPRMADAGPLFLLNRATRAEGLRVLAIGAHSDDLEIGAGGTILRLVADGLVSSVRWIVLSASGEREAEARKGAAAFLAGVSQVDVVIGGFRDGFFPYLGTAVKDFFEEQKGAFAPDLIFTHRREDLHQDHRNVADLTWNTYRNHTILEYEIPKYDGDAATPNFYVDLPEATAEQQGSAHRRDVPGPRPTRPVVRPGRLFAP